MRVGRTAMLVAIVVAIAAAALLVGRQQLMAKPSDLVLASRSIGQPLLTTDARGAPLFPGTLLLPGVPVTRCVTVHDNAPDPRSDVFVSVEDTYGALAPYLQVSVSVGRGSGF